jgi:hypothetical protein
MAIYDGLSPRSEDNEAVLELWIDMVKRYLAASREPHPARQRIR